MKQNYVPSAFFKASIRRAVNCSGSLILTSILFFLFFLIGTDVYAQYNITVSTSTSNGSWSGNTFVPSGNDATVAASEIVSRLNGGNDVTINTSEGGGSQHGYLTVSTAITKTSGGDATLILSADYRITISAAVSSTSNKLHIQAEAGKKVVCDGKRIGQFRIQSGGSITTNGGNVTATGVNNSCSSMNCNGLNYSCSGETCRGIQLEGPINAGGGNIILTALRRYTGYTQGARIESSVITTGSGTINISGQSDGNSHGTALAASGVVRTQNGSLTIIGYAPGSGDGINLGSGTVETTGTGNLILTSDRGSISGASSIIKSGGTTTITAGTYNITLSNANNSLTGTVSVASGVNVSLANSKAMPLGSVNAAGTIDIFTTTGDLTLNGNVSTSNTTSTAIRLYAGKNTSQPTSTGGNITIGSTGLVTTGSGGTAVLYTGSVSGSTGIAGLTNYNSTNVYYCTDINTVLNPTPGIGLYVAYRECAPPAPTGITATNNPICNGGSTQLTATGALGTVYWYTGSCGGTQVSTGNPITVSPSVTTTYYARNFNNGQFSTSCASITINVSSQPTAPGLTRNPDINDVCLGETLTVSTTDGGGGTGTITDEFRYSTDNGSNWSSWSTSVPSIAAVTGTNLIQSRRTATGSGCNTSSTNEVSWNVYNVFSPGAIETTGETICYDGDPAEIGSATDASGGDGLIVYKWEFSTNDFNTTGTEIAGAASSTYDPPSGLTETTSYRRYAKDGACNTDFEVSSGTWKVNVEEELTLSCPNNIEVNTDEGLCTASITFEATAGGTPTPSVTYAINNKPVTSPYNFSKGSSTVLVTASNYCGTITCSFTVIVTDNENPTIENLPVPINQSNDTRDCGAVVSWTEPKSNDNCSGHSILQIEGLASGSFLAVGTHTITYEATDASGNKVSDSFTIAITDDEAPEITCPTDVTISCEDSSHPDAVGTATATDNCDISPEITYSDEITPGPCTNTYTIIRTWKATDKYENIGTCTQTITVRDITKPMVKTKNITVELDATGNASITDNAVDDGSTDNCTGALIFSTNIKSFDCSDLGDNEVILTVTDACGNAASNTATVKVVDVIKPEAICKLFEVFLDDLGNTTIQPADVDNGSADNCGTITMTVIPNNFTCDNVGGNQVVLTVTDGSGNAASCTTTVTVTDNTNPTVLCKNITIDLDATGNATITPVVIDNGSADNCGIATMTLSRTEFSCADMGSAIEVTLTVTDVNGNTASCTATVTVNELSVPATRVNITAASAPNGQVKFTATPVNGGDNPTYQWYKNGEKIDGETGNELISTCKSGDEHWVIMTSSIPCTALATSNAMCTY